MNIRQRGVAAVELALIAIPLLLLVFGATELGRAFYYYNSLLKASRTAARYAINVQAGAHDAEIRCVAVYGFFTPGAAPCGELRQPVVPGLSTGMVGVAPGPAAPGTVRVTISGYQFLPMVNVFPAFTLGPVSTTMRRGAP